MSGSNTQVTASAKSTKGSTKGSKRPLLILCAMTAAGLLLVFGIVFFKNRDQLLSNQCRNTKESPLYNKANHAMTQLFKDDLKDTVATIKKQKNYALDASCLYPVVVHYIREGDAKNAQYYYDKMQFAYKDSVGFATVYGLNGRQTIQEMAPAVANLKIKEQLHASPKLPSVY